MTNEKTAVRDQSEAALSITMMELTLLVTVILVGLASAKVSLFLSSDQTKALYGIDTKDGLYYIREGVVNKYAMNFQHQVNNTKGLLIKCIKYLKSSLKIWRSAKTLRCPKLLMCVKSVLLQHAFVILF